MERVYKRLKYVLAIGAIVAAAGFSLAASRPDFALGRNIQILFNMFREVSLSYVDSVDTDKLLEDAAAGMVENLDPYTELIPENKMADFEIQTTGKYGGIGALIRKSGDYVAIAQPYEGFPADKAGLVIGDKLLAVDGENLKGYDVSKVSELLKGTPGTSMKLTVEKLLTGNPVDVSVKRERIVISGVPYYGVIDGDVGYILHDDFSEDCSDDMRTAFEKLKKQGITSLDHRPAGQWRRHFAGSREDSFDVRAQRHRSRVDARPHEIIRRDVRDASRTARYANSDRRAGEQYDGLCRRDRVGSVAGSRPCRAGRTADVRQRIGADSASAGVQRFPESDYREILHSQRPLYPGDRLYAPQRRRQRGAGARIR